MSNFLLYKRLFNINVLPFITCLCIQLASLSSTAYSQTANEYLLKSIFLLRVTNFVEWPQNSKVKDISKDFNIFIYGEDPFENKLESIVKNKTIKIKNKTIKIKRINSIDEIKNADMLFISSSEKYNLSKLMKEAEKYPILTIGDTKGYTDRGIMINMYVEDNLLKFDINMLSVKKKNIYISSKLLSNAKKIVE